MAIQSGYPFYGQPVGILVFSTTTPRIPGDAGHAASFAYPVRYEVVKGGFADLIQGGEEVRNYLIQACRNLKQAGIQAAVGDCGLMSLYQQDIARETGITFAASSLVLIPTVWQLIGRQGRIGILTGDSTMLSEKHLKGSGWAEDIPLAIQGLQDEPHFNEIVIKGGHNLDPERMQKDVLHAASVLQQNTPDLGAIIIECSNLGTYAAALHAQCQVPVFDVIAAANLLAYGVQPPRYPQP